MRVRTDELGFECCTCLEVFRNLYSNQIGTLNSQNLSHIKIAVSLLIAGYSFERKRAMRATPKKKCVWQCGVLNVTPLTTKRANFI